MRVGLDLQSTRGEVSGIGAYASGLAAALAAHGRHSYCGLAYRGFTRWPAAAELARSQVALPASAWRRRLDVIHAPGFAPPRWGRARRLLTLHDLSVWDRPELLPRGPARWYWREAMAWGARHADGLVAVSHFTAERAQAAWGVPEARLRVVPYPPRPQFRPASRARLAALRRRVRLPERFILGVGAMEPRKDWLGVLRAWARIERRCEVGLVLAGPVNVPASRRRLEAALADLGDGRLRRRVVWLGYAPLAHLPALYSAAALFVFPETYAGYGLPMLEAMACGTPVVSYANSALPEVAAGAAVLVRPPYAPAATAEAMQAVLESEPLRAALAQRGLDRVRQLRWSDTARVMDDIYEAAA